jgi:hypothetical protein
MFPLNTFEKLQTAEIYSIEGRSHQAIQKYVRRGWTLVPRLEGGLEWKSKIRRVGDRGCWTIRLQDSPTVPCTLTLNSWKRIDFLTGDFVLSGRQFTHPQLHYSYRLAHNFIADFMVKVLAQLRNKKYVILPFPISAIKLIDSRDKNYIGPLDAELKQVSDKKTNIRG